jgi:hypothetical protein
VRSSRSRARGDGSDPPPARRCGGGRARPPGWQRPTRGRRRPGRPPEPGARPDPRRPSAIRSRCARRRRRPTRA